MLEDTKLLLTAIASEIRKNPEQAIAKIEKLRQQIPNSYEGFRTKKNWKKPDSNNCRWYDYFSGRFLFHQKIPTFTLR